MTHVKLAIKDLLTFGQLVFPSMNTSFKDLAAYVEVTRTCNGPNPYKLRHPPG